MRRLQHFLQVGIEETWRQAVALGKLCRELAIGFGDSHHLQILAVLKLVEESGGMPMHESCKRDAQWRFLFFSRGLGLSTQISERARQQDYRHREHDKKRVASHEPPSWHWCIKIGRPRCALCRHVRAKRRTQQAPCKPKIASPAGFSLPRYALISIPLPIPVSVFQVGFQGEV